MVNGCGVVTGGPSGGGPPDGGVGPEDWPGGPPPGVGWFAWFGVLGWFGLSGWFGAGAGGDDAPSPPGLSSPFVGSCGLYLTTRRSPPSERSTPARSLAGSLKNTTPSRLNNWKRVAPGSTCGRASTCDVAMSTIHTWPVA